LEVFAHLVMALVFKASDSSLCSSHAIFYKT